MYIYMYMSNVVPTRHGNTAELAGVQGRLILCMALARGVRD